MFLCDNRWKLLGCFQHFDFKTNFLKIENLFHKNGVPFLVETTKFENPTLPWRTALLEANVTTNRIGSTKRPITKKGVLPVTALLFWKSYFGRRTSSKELIWCTNYSVSIHILFVSTWVLFEGAFSLWVSLIP